MSEKEARLELNATFVQFDGKDGLVQEIPASSKEFGSFDTGIEVPQEIIREIYNRENVQEQSIGEQVEQRPEEKHKTIKDFINSKDDVMSR